MACDVSVLVVFVIARVASFESVLVEGVRGGFFLFFLLVSNV